MSKITTFDVSGTTPGADSNTDTMWDTTTTVNGHRVYPKHFFAMQGIHRAELTIVHDQDGTVKWYASNDGGTSWNQVGTQAVTAVSNEASIVDPIVEGYPDFKIEWTNGGTAQSPWYAKLNLLTERSVAG